MSDTIMNRKLALVASTGDIDGMKKFKDDINQVDSDGNTVLHLAAMFNQSRFIVHILKEFPDLLYKVNLRNETALHLSASEGNTGVVKLLIQKLTDEDSGIIKTLMAKRNLDMSLVRELESDIADSFIKRYGGSDFKKGNWVSAKDIIRTRNSVSDTALHLAVQNNHPKVVELIVKADPNHRHDQNSDSETPLYMACATGYTEAFKTMFDKCRDPGYSGPNGRTILHAAIERRDTETAKDILRERRDLYTIADENGWTAFHYAAYHNCGSILKPLLQQKVDSVNDVLRCRDKKSKMSALHTAASQGYSSIVIDLMKFYTERIPPPDDDHLVNTAEVDEEGQNTQQKMTAHRDHYGDNISIDEVDEKGQNILHIAADKELVLSILKDCPREPISRLLNAKDKNEDTPLHLLAQRGCFVPELIRHKDVDRNAKNKDKFTPHDLLYVSDRIVCDQLMIKDALEDNTQYINQRWNFSLRRKKSLQKNEGGSLLSTSKRITKDAKFDEERDCLIKKEVTVYRARINTQIIVTALITTVTFTVGFTMPGGYHQSGVKDEGSAVLSKKTAFKVFVLADTLALLLSMYSLALYFVASMYQDAKEISKLVDASTVLNIISVVATMLTFVMGIYLVLPHSSDIVIAVMGMSGVFVFLITLLIIKVMKDPIKKFRE